jgi:ATP-dependent helicase/nuclease subunit A
MGAKAKAPFSAKVGTLPTKATQPKLGALLDRLENLMRRVETTRGLRLAAQAARRTATLHAFAAAFLPEYAARKAARGLLDFDDLITRARALLTDPAVAQWVLFRLDGGIDHILVDEAQDTSPDQWRVIELLAAEFTAGRGTRDDAGRTIFVVGDKKQSIYSFQGARVDAFDEKRNLFADRLAAAGRPLQDLALLHSFRSSPAILGLVDLTFDDRRAAGLGGEVKHIAHKSVMPGRVDLWPHIEKSEKPESREWFDPVDLVTDDHHAAVLAERVAQTIADAIAQGVQIHSKQGIRPVHAGDFLILVRRRSDIFSEIIRACKARNLPIAGADRLKLGAELAVRDLASLLAFLATPDDDLSLAEALKSPIFGWTEQQLFTLAQPRKGLLWQALRESDHAATLAVLHDLRDQADFLRPYDLLERILTRHNARQALIARLGAEAEDGIDELLSQALAYERNDIPSLTGFLGWLQTDDVDVKRQMDSAGAKIRVMTIHGAKGLEAPVVILPDTAQPKTQERDEIFDHPEGPLWKTATAESPAQIAALREERKALAEAESLRLLYVAMTRAQSWLIVGSAGTLGKDGSDDDAPTTVWYKQIREGMEAIGATPTPDGGMTYRYGDWPAATGQPGLRQPSAKAPLPAWTGQEATVPPRPVQLLNPSQLGGAKALPGESLAPELAMERGTRLHLLLELLPGQPQSDWPAIAQSYAAADLLAEAAGVLTAPHLAHLFAPGTLAEVSLTADLDGQPMVGTIDRLVLSPGKVLAVDYKSNTVVPQTVEEVPDGLIRQMAAYTTALGQIYPDRKIETAILWTRNAQLMPLDPDIVRGVAPAPTIP